MSTKTVSNDVQQSLGSCCDDEFWQCSRSWEQQLKHSATSGWQADRSLPHWKTIHDGMTRHLTELTGHEVRQHEWLLFLNYHIMTTIWWMWILMCALRLWRYINLLLTYLLNIILCQL